MADAGRRVSLDCAPATPGLAVLSTDVTTRVDELEIRAAFQEDLIATLNRDVSDLSVQVQRLRDELRRVRDSVESVRADVGHAAGDEPPPPHY
jgi:SlyX protein